MYEHDVAGTQRRFRWAIPSGKGLTAQELEVLSQPRPHHGTTVHPVAQSDAHAEEMEVARRMQLRLLPSAEQLAPALERAGLTLETRFKSCNAVGGDLWGAYELGDGGMAFYAFDLSGHGVPAALNVFRLHALIGDVAVRRDDPAGFLSILNDTLCGQLGPGQFATMFHMVVRDGHLTWSSAAAPRPLLVCPQGLGWLDTTGMPLGLRPHAAYTNRTCAFPRGTGLLFTSDAVSEAETLDGGLLGEEGVEGLVRTVIWRAGKLALEPLFARFYREVRLPLTDDLTALWIERS